MWTGASQDGLRKSRRTETVLPSPSEPSTSPAFAPSLHRFCLPVPDTQTATEAGRTVQFPKHALTFARVSPSHQNAFSPYFSAHWTPVPIRLNATSSEKHPVYLGRIQFSALGAPEYPLWPFLSFQHLFHSVLIVFPSFSALPLFSELPKGKSPVFLIFLIFQSPVSIGQHRLAHSRCSTYNGGMNE